MVKKITLLLFISITALQVTIAQLKAKAICPVFEVDVLAGTVNMLQPKSAIADIQAIFPCFSEMLEKDSASRCAGVFYGDKDIYFFTDRKYIEIGQHFKGNLSPQLMGVNRNNLFKLLGYPKLKDTGWDAFQMGYGTLVLYYDKAGRINKLQICNRSTDAIRLCE